ncbi:alkyl hydroperoxide reductase subunit AhpC [Anaerosolibacter carboniphilus]|uniref:Alkyl hydroperoxide reductase subunit AhpC n=2 Tax=Anaerosolibacter carboniphilus TaxID=1417629 RepID=A0A841KU38_9FIRM|nr:alkyl hydroperoxide reductase subunit AhpC [Anaerosolibacter carboniphilus]
MNMVTLDMVAPSFQANAFINNIDQQITLQSYQGKWLILFFYGNDFTFV